VKVILGNLDQENPCKIYYFPVNLAEETIGAIEKSEDHEWVPIITENHKTLDWNDQQNRTRRTRHNPIHH
jgi:hypothetical protein